MPTLPIHNPVAIFMVVLVIILGAPLLFRRLKIPNIVGLILAGVAIGPYGLNVLERDASFQIFGQVGILYLMFLAAVEIDMYHLRRNFRHGIIFGLISFTLPMVAGIFCSRWAFGVGWDTAVLISSMYASHTLVSYPIVSRFGLQNVRPAVIAVCATIVSVLLALIALAEVVAVKALGHVDPLGILKLIGLMGIYAVVVGYTFPWLTRRFLRNVSDSVGQFIFILALVCLASLLAQAIGLEGILGAFYAGLVLNRLIPVRSALMRRIEFAGNAIFIPYFLIGVGMLLNVHVIFNGWGVGWAALNMVVVALGTKWVAAWGTQRLFGLSGLDRLLMFGLTGGKAAATIAATMIGFQYGLLSEDLMNGAVMMILVCCIVASVTTERAAIRMRIAETAASLEREGAHQEGPGFARQLVAVANPVTARGLMSMAVFMRHPDNREKITGLFVRTSDDRRVVRDGREAMSAAASEAQAMDIRFEEVERYDLNITTGMVNVAHEHHSTDLIIGLHRKSNIVDTFYGNLIEGLLTSTRRMIIISRCFIPVDTVKRLVVVVPANAEYEKGFRAWVARVCNLAAQLSCQIRFMAYAPTCKFIEEAIREGGYAVRRHYSAMGSWDDFIVLSGEIGDDDLLMIVSARRGTVSSCTEWVDMPGFLSRHFARANIVVIYPDQDAPVSSDPHAIVRV